MEPTREQIFRLAIQHSDQQQYSRDRTLNGFNFSKDGLLDFAREVRKLSATPEEAEAERWKDHIRMERHFYDPAAERGSGQNVLKDDLRELHASAVAAAREFGATEDEVAAVEIPVEPTCNWPACNCADNLPGMPQMCPDPGKGKPV